MSGSCLESFADRRQVSRFVVCLPRKPFDSRITVLKTGGQLCAEFRFMSGLAAHNRTHMRLLQTDNPMVNPTGMFTQHLPLLIMNRANHSDLFAHGFRDEIRLRIRRSSMNSRFRRTAFNRTRNALLRLATPHLGCLMISRYLLRQIRGLVRGRGGGFSCRFRNWSMRLSVSSRASLTRFKSVGYLMSAGAQVASIRIVPAFSDSFACSAHARIHRRHPEADRHPEQSLSLPVQSLFH